MARRLKDRYLLGGYIARTPGGGAYEGFDSKFDRKTIIRIVENGASGDLNSRFVRFMKSAGRLGHPGILSVLDYGTDGDDAFSVHEYIDTPDSVLSLSAVEDLEPEEKTGIVRSMLDILSYAHSAGIQHRNLYTDSVYILDDGRVKLDFFDLRRYFVKEALLSEFGFSSEAPLFITPEELRGRPDAKKGDIFQFGCCAYMILTGTVPFKGKKVEKTIRNILSGELVKPDYISPEAGKYSHILEKCLSIAPEDRYASFDEVIDDFRLADSGGRQRVSHRAPYKFEMRDDEAYMTISPIMASKANIEEIEKRFLEENIFNYDLERIADCIRHADGKAHPVGLAFKKCDPVSLSDIDIEVTADSMEAYLKFSILPAVSVDEAVFHLKKNGVRFGIDRQAVRQVLDTGRQDIPVARGVKPVDGEDAWIHYFFEKENLLRPKVLEDGDVDFKEIHSIQESAAGDVLCLKIPATEGAPGKTVFNTPIEAKKGRDKKLPIGAKTYVSQDGLKLLASIDGQIMMEHGKVHIKELIIINGDVDYSTGNVRYRGDIIIRGNVLPDFMVSAGGDIKVHGVVEGAYVESLRGSVFVKSGVFGKEKGEIHALRDIKADFLQDVTAEAGRNITAFNYIRNSDVKCGRHLKCKTGNGSVVGSTIQAGTSVEVNIAGTNPYVRTSITVLVRTALELKQRMEELQHRNEETEAALASVKRQMKQIVIRCGSEDNAADDREYRLLTDKMKHLEEYIAETEVRLENVTADYDERDDDFRETVKVRRFLYGDVSVRIGNSVFVSKEEYEGKMEFFSDGGKVVIKGI
ncbi:FapA family protein [Limisalsivibrio acetivorans]|uniref:FapA family protein n=1 Tax=Limisalsivibrio acetivorans TaxID=1304888 RepID=UPI0003B45BB5|nr:FapA family protein [Limisalsivibrio acetivorans]